MKTCSFVSAEAHGTRRDVRGHQCHSHSAAHRKRPGALGRDGRVRQLDASTTLSGGDHCRVEDLIFPPAQHGGFDRIDGFPIQA
jgi:hypothetical protein